MGGFAQKFSGRLDEGKKRSESPKLREFREEEKHLAISTPSSLIQKKKKKTQVYHASGGNFPIEKKKKDHSLGNRQWY